MSSRNTCTAFFDRFHEIPVRLPISNIASVWRTRHDIASTQTPHEDEDAHDTAIALLHLVYHKHAIALHLSSDVLVHRVLSFLMRWFIPMRVLDIPQYGKVVILYACMPLRWRTRLRSQTTPPYLYIKTLKNV